MNTSLTLAIVILTYATRAQGESVEDVLKPPDLLHQQRLDLVESATYPFKDGGVGEGVIHYRLFKPLRDSSVAASPLIIWLHDTPVDYVYGQDSSQLECLKALLRDPAHPELCKFHLLMPQLPKNWHSWFGNPEDESSQCSQLPCEAVMAIIGDLLPKNEIDKDRIYLMGRGEGGTSCWKLAIRYPEVFAAVVPLDSRPTNLERLERLKSTTIWAFQPSEGSSDARAAVQKLGMLGGACSLTEIPSTDGNCLDMAVNKYNLLNWMLEQRRGIPTTPVPGLLSRVAHWLDRNWPPLLIGLLLCLLRLAWKSESTRRQQTAHASGRSSLDKQTDPIN